MSKRICVLGLTISGNRGAESMLLSIMRYMDEELGKCNYDLVSVYPSEDSAQNSFPNLRVVSGKPFTVLAAFGVSLAFGWLSFLPFVRKMLSLNPILASILKSDIVLDSSGVAFIDGRGIALLGYNACLCTPPTFLNKPIVKLSQALGPFKTQPNRALAKLVLSRLQLVIARGDITASHLEELGLTNFDCCADSAFAMPVQERDVIEAKELLKDLPPGRRLLGISPSTVVDAYVAKEGKSYKSLMTQFVKEAVNRDLHVVLIPHSVRPGSNERMNNDLIVCREIAAELGETTYVTVIDKELTAPVLRALIGEMSLYVASRFHSMVSSLSMKNPTLLIGWSHKYREVMRMFDLEDYALSFSDLSAKRLSQELSRLIAEESIICDKLELHLPAVQQSARNNFTLAASVLVSSKTMGGNRVNH